MKKLISAVILFLLVAVTLAGCSSRSAQAVRLTVSDPVTCCYYGEQPDFSLAEYKAVFSDGTEEKLTFEDISAECKDYDAWTEGFYTVNIKCEKYNLEYSYSLEVKGMRENIQWRGGTSLKVLAVGNSFTDDTMQWVGQIARSTGYGIKLGIAYYGGCSLEQHYNFAMTNQSVYEFRTNANGAIATVGKLNLHDAIISDDWDIVVLQENSILAATGNVAYLTPLMQYIKGLTTNPDVKFIYNMTWCYNLNNPNLAALGGQRGHFEKVVSNVKKYVLPDENFITVTPIGKAVWNAVDSGMNKYLYRDELHLSYVFGRYIAGLTFACKLTGVNPQNVSFVPDGITEEQVAAAKTFAEEALANPFKLD